MVTDVWTRFAAAPTESQRVLFSPSEDATAIELASTLHYAILQYRGNRWGEPRATTASVASLNNYVVATIYLDELLNIVLPLTTWWTDKNLDTLTAKAESRYLLERKLKQAIRIKLGVEITEERESIDEATPDPSSDEYPSWRVLEASQVAALVGFFALWDRFPEVIPEPPDEREQRFLDFDQRVHAWISLIAPLVVEEASAYFSRIQENSLAEGYADVALVSRSKQPGHRRGKKGGGPILRVFLDRRARLSDTEALSTIKADAADRVFEVTCKDLTWAIIDSGVASTHPAFKEHSINRRASNGFVSRVRRTFDFSLIEKIRNFDLAYRRREAKDRQTSYMDALVDELVSLHGNVGREFRAKAYRNLNLIGSQMGRGLQPAWALIEPLIELQADDGKRLSSDHGTHVAGVLGGDWRSDSPSQSEGRRMGSQILRGVCPDINLYDMRVLNKASNEATEFALISALEFIQFLNTRAGSNGPEVHGVNVSMSIAHDVRNYGCGATPVCVASDRLSNSGVVVVAAAGNRGWNEQEHGFGLFNFCSITDPGNAQQVITVGSTHRLKPHTYGVSFFSSRGPTGDGRLKPDLVAPGEKIRGPVRGKAEDELDGTSMAAPFVSGAAAMLMARNVELIGNPQRIKRILCDTATDLGREKYFQGHGLVDVLRALQAI